MKFKITMLIPYDVFENMLFEGTNQKSELKEDQCGESSKCNCKHCHNCTKDTVIKDDAIELPHFD